MQENTGEPHKTLLDWAHQLRPESPRSRIKGWIKEGRFLLDGQPLVQAGMRMPDPGDRLTFGASANHEDAWTRRIHPKLAVVHLDSDLAIVNKEAGLLSVPRPDDTGHSVLGLLETYLNDPAGAYLRQKIFGSAKPVQALPVHRLDQYTSGLLCIALNPEARADLIEQLRSKELLREYLAFTDGIPAANQGIWRHYLKLDERGYQQSVQRDNDPDATLAVTHFQVEQQFPRYSACRLRLRLDTGLKHQIRLQAATEGVPLFGDRQYHKATRAVLARGARSVPFGMKRQALHAATLGLRHPSTGKALQFDARLPKDLQALQDRLSDRQPDGSALT